jgi:hypothetical protein
LKTLLKRKLVAIPLAIAVLSLIITGTVFAVTSFIIPGQVNVVPATSDIKLYSDPSFTNELKSLAWGDLPAGSGTRFRTIYIQNLANCDVDVVATAQNLPSGVTLAEEPKTMLTRGGNGSLTIRLTASQTATMGLSTGVTLTITSTPVPNPVPTP